MTRARRILVLLSILALAGARGSPAYAADPAPGDADVAAARAEFARGNELAKQEDWAEALAAFTRSYQRRPHPITAYNVATCRRVLGQYVHALELFEEVLSPASVGELTPPLVENARGYKEELDHVVTRVAVTLAPADMGVAIDGRPLKVTGRVDAAGRPVLAAGVLPSGPGATPPAGAFELVVDPGSRVLVLSRKGYRDVVRTERFAAGARASLALELEKLPAILHIAANVPRPIVTVDGADVGLAPVDVTRPAGRYRVVVRKSGYVDHEMMVDAAAGDEARLDAKLAVEEVPLTKRWWFWAGTAALVVGGAAVTYAATRPEPQPPDFQRGNTGWLVPLSR